MARTKRKLGDGAFAFVDVENIRGALQSEGYKDLDYSKLFTWLKENRGVNRIYLYLGVKENDEEKANRYKELSKITNCFVSVKKVMVYNKNPINLKTKCPKCKHNFDRIFYPRAELKANCDVELTLDVIRFGLRKRYKEIIVFSGDGDFSKLYEYISNELQKKVTVYAPSDNNGIKRTALSVKKLHKKGVITLEDLRGLFGSYAIK